MVETVDLQVVVPVIKEPIEVAEAAAAVLDLLLDLKVEALLEYVSSDIPTQFDTLAK
tara:strand:- start:47 stop:217 length:171 start_codon:yes stop_codon:yes gene_type:complete